jgi:hypothetical protein
MAIGCHFCIADSLMQSDSDPEKQNGSCSGHTSVNAKKAPEWIDLEWLS